MAIYQISQIQQRAGLQIDLPQLAGAQLGWSYDTRQLWIGNGTLEEGAPVVGNTEILTEFSDILALPSSYTFKGTAAGYTAQGTVPLSLQDWMDQWVSIKDFGATGDGVTDDTNAINTALYQIYCVQGNVQSRRAIYFPAGVYKVSSTINIPPYARLYGEGIGASIIQMIANPSFGTTAVAQTADSNMQTGLNIGALGAIPPTDICITNMSFASLSNSIDIFRLNSTNGAAFTQVSFIGPLTQDELTSASYSTAAIRLLSNGTFGGFITKNFAFINCETTGTTWAGTSASISGGTDYPSIDGLFDSMVFGTHYQGIVLGTGSAVVANGPTGIRVCNSIFKSIYAEGIIFGKCQLNATGYNIFYDVGNHFNGFTAPETYNLVIQSSNNLSIGDLFARTDAYAQEYIPGQSWPRVNIDNSISIAFDGTDRILLGNYSIGSGYRAPLLNNQPVYLPVINEQGNPVNIYTENTVSFKIEYSIIRDTSFRTGSIMVAADSGSRTSALVGDLSWDDTFVENRSTGVTLMVMQLSPELIQLQYISTNTAVQGTLTYSITQFA